MHSSLGGVPFGTELLGCDSLSLIGSASLRRGLGRSPGDPGPQSKSPDPRRCELASHREAMLVTNPFLPGRMQEPHRHQLQRGLGRVQPAVSGHGLYLWMATWTSDPDS